MYREGVGVNAVKVDHGLDKQQQCRPKEIVIKATIKSEHGKLEQALWNGSVDVGVVVNAGILFPDSNKLESVPLNKLN